MKLLKFLESLGVQDTSRISHLDYQVVIINSGMDDEEEFGIDDVRFEHDSKKIILEQE